MYTYLQDYTVNQCYRKINPKHHINILCGICVTFSWDWICGNYQFWLTTDLLYYGHCYICGFFVYNPPSHPMNHHCHLTGETSHAFGWICWYERGGGDMQMFAWQRLINSKRMRALIMDWISVGWTTVERILQCQWIEAGVRLCNTYVFSRFFSLLHVMSNPMFPHLHNQPREGIRSRIQNITQQQTITMAAKEEKIGSGGADRKQLCRNPLN